MLMVTIPSPKAALKGRPPPRSVPEDFDVIFVEQGRDGCVEWYRAHKRMITRWLVERDAVRAKQKLPSLVEARAAYVSHQRKNGNWLTRSTSMVEIRKAKPNRLEAIRDRRKVSSTVARHAAQHLRIIRHGGFIVSQAPNGDWRVGTRLLSAAQLVDFAVSKGFDAKGCATDEQLGISPAVHGYWGQQASRPPQPDVADVQTFNCGHPRTADNVRKKADGRERCRECNRRYNLASISRVRAARRRSALQNQQSGKVDS